MYGYRWVVLLTYMFIGLMMQVFWICYAPITKVAAETLGVSDLEIGLLAMLFMYVYIPAGLARFLGDRHLGFQEGGQFGRHHDGGLRLAARRFRRGLHADADHDHRAGRCPAALPELRHQVGRQLVPPGRARHDHRDWRHRHTLGHRHRPDRHADPAAKPRICSPPCSSMAFSGAISALVFVVLAKDRPPTPAGHEERVLMLAGLRHIFNVARLLLAGVCRLRDQRHLQWHLHLGGGDRPAQGPGYRPGGIDRRASDDRRNRWVSGLLHRLGSIAQAQTGSDGRRHHRHPVPGLDGLRQRVCTLGRCIVLPGPVRHGRDSC